MEAINDTNYISKQKGRNIEILKEFINDPRYISKKNLITKGNLFNMDFIFNDIAYIYNPFDFKTFEESNQELVVGAMNCTTGETTFFKKSEESSNIIMTALRDSSSLPFVQKKVKLNNSVYLDGGLSDPIPVRKAFEDGCDKVIVILTRNENYVKKAFKSTTVAKLFYKKHPKVLDSLERRHYVYTETQHYLKTLESNSNALVLRPKKPLEISRTEKKLKKLKMLLKKDMTLLKK